MRAEANVTHSMSPRRIELAEELFSKITIVLNELHNCNHPVQFWMLVAEEHVRWVINNHKTLGKPKLPADGSVWTSGHRFVKEFLRRARGYAAGLYRYMQTRDNIREVHAAIKENNQLLAGFEGIPKIREETGGRHLPDAERFAFGRGSRRKRAEVLRLAGRAESELHKNMIETLPPVLVEHFSNLFEKIPLYSPEKREFHVRGSFSSGYRQLVLAKYQLYGARLIWYQNGAVVAEVTSKYGGYLARTVSDEFRTWGWKENDSDKPWKSYDLIRFADSYRAAQTDGSKYDLLLSFPKIRYESDYYRDLTERLLNGLDREKYRDIMIRPYPTIKKRPEETFHFLNGRGITLNTQKTTMADDLKRSEMAIHVNVPATSFLEALSVGHPTTGILRNGNPTAMILPYYRFFLDFNVLHQTPESLSEHLNSVDPETWWAGVTAAPEFHRFRSEFLGDWNTGVDITSNGIMVNGTGAFME